MIGEDREYTVEYEHGDTVWFVVDTDTWEKEGKIVLKIGAKVVRKIFFEVLLPLCHRCHASRCVLGI